MAAEVWKAQFGRLVEEAAIRVDGVRESLHALLPQLTSSSSSMVAGDANTVRDTIQLALDALGLGDESSCSNLASAISFTVAARLLALRGDGINPAVCASSQGELPRGAERRNQAQLRRE
ncbi:Os03g0373300 [Oryza sativa Japonica Group]|jgi:hypothetical protein|uniref:Os03g0373300 protein n=1 Tax=Oryza sativa subsp. japonica TaxID=39947 RepID=A0A0P0VY08_ORYSJ|nr:hypothetical protein EE612_017661 [Oryza sativa]BAS84384.1 Os03g0373300 [Oryza sativa Japonica Group]